MDEVVDLIDALEGEVNNGGFHQYFYNSAGDRTAETIQALEIIGAFAMADIVTEPFRSSHTDCRRRTVLSVRTCCWKPIRMQRRFKR